MNTLSGSTHPSRVRAVSLFVILAAATLLIQGCAVLAGGAAGAATGYIAGKAAQ